MAPIVQQNPAVNKEFMVLATGAGSAILSHVNDAGSASLYSNLTFRIADYRETTRNP